MELSPTFTQFATAKILFCAANLLLLAKITHSTIKANDLTILAKTVVIAISLGGLGTITWGGIRFSESKKPAVPDTARLRFSFATKDSEQFPVTMQPVQVVNGIATITIMASNDSDVLIHQAEVLIRICEACKYVKEPVGSVKTSETAADDRNRILGTFYPGTHIEVMTIDISVLPTVSEFDIAIDYACDVCGRANRWQILRAKPIIR